MHSRLCRGLALDGSPYRLLLGCLIAQIYRKGHVSQISVEADPYMNEQQLQRLGGWKASVSFPVCLNFRGIVSPSVTVLEQKGQFGRAAGFCRGKNEQATSSAPPSQSVQALSIKIVQSQSLGGPLPQERKR